MPTEPIHIEQDERNERNAVQFIHRVRIRGRLLPAAIDWLPQPLSDHAMSDHLPQPLDTDSE